MGTPATLALHHTGAPATSRLPSKDSASGTALRSGQSRCATSSLDALLREYAANKRPIDVSFREMVGPIPVNDLTHSIYPYPARLLRQIPRFLLRCEQLVTSEDVVLDPFCGSGTVLVEARAASITSWGIDSNPFARLLSRAKTTPLSADTVRSLTGDVLLRAKAMRSGLIPEVVNVDLWFSKPVKGALGRIRRAVDELRSEPDQRRLLLLMLALTAERCSLRDPRIPVPVRRPDWSTVASKQKARDVWNTFGEVATLMAARVCSLPATSGVVSVVEGDDATQAESVYWNRLANQMRRPRLILTSPPYGAGQKYIRSTSLALGWTGLATAAGLAPLERQLIGREHLHLDELTVPDVSNLGITRELRRLISRDSVRAAIYAHYFRAMDQVMKNLSSLLVPGGTFVLVAGSNTVAGRLMPTHHHLRALATSHGLAPVLELRDALRGRVLLTKRATSGRPLPYETIHVLKKPSS
jgi:SAM-dependent methyltransferase